jgi:hemolysin-activating ACP:hemolysin acyltransferase
MRDTSTTATVLFGSADHVADWNATLVGVLGLMARSPLHSRWSVADVERLIVPPLALGQCAVLRDGPHVVGFASYALLTEEAEIGYVEGTRKIQPTDWNAGDRLWLVDVIAPYGHARQVMRHGRAMLKARGLGGHDVNFKKVYTTDRPRRTARVKV